MRIAITSNVQEHRACGRLTHLGGRWSGAEYARANGFVNALGVFGIAIAEDCGADANFG
jgi:hypothetical protein